MIIKKFIPVILATFILLAAMPTMAQNIPDVQVNNVPASGYSGTDTIILSDMWNEYVVDVPKGHELEYSFQVIGNGSIRVLLVNEVGTISIMEAQVNYYLEFSDFGPVTSYSATFPPDFSLPQDYTILVNSTGGEVTYDVSISINEVDAPDYTIYYVLLPLGLVGILVFSWITVNRQDQAEKKAKQNARDKRKSSRGKRRR